MEYRYLYKSLENHLSHKNYTIITGARQVGKSSLLKQLFFYLKNNKEEVVLLNLENKELLVSLNKDVKSIFTHVQLVPQKIINGKTSQRIYLLIDEIQYLDNPTNFLKFLYDEYEYNVKVVVTGSSAFYIDAKFKDSLAGRKRVFQLYPLSFNEFLVFKRQEKINKEIAYHASEPSYVSQYLTSTESLLREYLTYGGYPAIVLENDWEEKKHLLNELKNSYLRRDILESGVDKENKFLMLVKLLADQIGNLVNKNELGNTIGLDNKTVEHYVYILEKCFHVDLLKPFYRNLRKELTKMPKVYFNDLGLRNSILGRFENPINRIDKGALLENFIYNQLRIKHDSYLLKYWRTADGNEVDFVVEESFDNGYALEVKWDKSQFKPKKYKKFVSSYPNFPLSCVDFYTSEILLY
ncbi:MAG: AAA family ATPase [Flavobacteriales bacterium CG_4_9_14_3_um_filter_32_8]|nr:MAG: AAA family ATPase [Flavobacteriales bacterium CG_4_9_14_3_um_filter_32_8]